MKDKFKILVLDGGGSRGILPAAFLNQLERKIGPLTDIFDLMVGTSTGGIIAAGLGRGMSAGEILELYNSEIPRIFERPLSWKVRTAWGMLGPKYDNANMREVMQEYLGDGALSQAKTRFIVTAYNTADNDVILIDSKDSTLYGFADAAIATSSAPVYFPSYMNLVDGGIYANNPVLIGIAEAQKLGYALQDIVVLNIGTGFNVTGWNTSRFGVKNWLITEKSKPLIDMMFDAMAEKDSYIAKRLLGANYMYLNPALHKKYPMDVVAPKVLKHLEMLGEQLFHNSSYEILELLGKNFYRTARNMPALQ